MSYSFIPFVNPKLTVLQYASPDIPSLKGCIHDPQVFKAFLTDSLHVPDSQIRLLTNENAARNMILDTFHEHLTMITNIYEGDPIVFFYAGYGSRRMAGQ